MNAEEKRLVAALRSGRYTQTTDRLRQTYDNYFGTGGPQGHCCLGVYCDISGQGSFDEDDVFILSGDSARIMGEETVLPPALKNALGWYDNTGVLSINNRKGLFNSLAELNDGGFTFDQIADLIEAGLVLREGESFPAPILG